MEADLVDNVGWLREQTDLPICIGFGISKPEHVRMLAPVADGSNHDHIFGERVCRCPTIIALASWNIHFVVGHPYATDQFCWLLQSLGNRFVDKVQADFGLIDFLFDRRMIMNLHDHHVGVQSRPIYAAVLVHDQSANALRQIYRGPDAGSTEA